MCLPWNSLSVYAKEVNDNTKIKVSITWTISSRDIADYKIENNDDLHNIIECKPADNVHIELSINFNSEISTQLGMSRAEIKQFIKKYPDGYKEVSTMFLKIF